MFSFLNFHRWVGRLFLFSLFIFSTLVGCESRRDDLSSKPVIKVNERILTLRDFATQLARRLKDLDALSAKNTQTIALIKEELLRSFITRSLILDFSESKKIEISNHELDKEVDRIRALYPDDVSFRRTLADENISFSEWREQLKFRLIEQKVFQLMTEKIKPATSEDVKQFYQQNLAQYKTKERIYVRQIVVEDQAKADLMKAEIVKKKGLEALAKQYSITPEGKNGGVVGWIGKDEVEFFDPLFSYKIGVPGPIFKSPYGYHIAVVEKKSPATSLTLEEVRSRIELQIRAQKEQALFTEWLDAQLRSSRVWRDYKLIEAVSVDTK
jgi:peptidyl-prolyl cis-trans isomerase C